MGAFNELYEADLRGEFYGAMCRWHLRRDGQITIYEIIIENTEHGKGLGYQFLQRLKQVKNATSIFAKCPDDLASNDWYKKQGFILEDKEVLKSGKVVNHWRLKL